MLTLKQQIESLWAKKQRLDASIRQDERVLDLIDHIRDEKKPLFDKIDVEIAELEAQRKPQRPKTPRWPIDCPKKVIEACAEHWSGTTEHSKFRIHMWSETKAITSYPGQTGWSGVGSTQYYQPHYRMISLNSPRSGGHSNYIREWAGRLSKKEMAAALAEPLTRV